MKSVLLAALVFFSIHAGFSQRNITSLAGITTTHAFNDKVFFVASHDQYGVELFVSNGVSGNYTLVKDISPGYGSSTPGQFIIFNNQLFFTAYTPEYGTSLWKTDGTGEGTELVYGAKEAYPANLTIFKGKLYFTTALGSIMRTDGTAAGTQVFFQADFTSGRIMTMVKDEDYIYFTPNGRTIYRDNGSSRINFLGPLSWESVSYKNLFVLDNALVVIKSSTYDDVIRIYSIPKNILGDQQEDEWQVIKKLDAPTYGRQEIENYTNVSGKLFFSFRTYYDNVTPTDELWICDGTEAGTKLVKSFGWSPHFYQSEMGMFFQFKGKLFFRAGTADNRALWTSDGTTQGTSKFHDVVITPPYNDERTPVLVSEDRIYFSGSNDGYNAELWQSDGTAAGTKLYLDLEDDGGSSPHDFSITNDVLYFITSQQFSSTLWSTMPAADISVAGTWGSVMKSGSKPYLFPAVAKGSCTTREIVIRNKGLEELYLRNILLTGRDFYLVQKSMPETIAPGESVSLGIVVNPVNEGTTTATLTILSNDIDEPKYVIYLHASTATWATSEICQFPESGYVKSLTPDESIKPIVLSSYSIMEGQPKGTAIGAFSLPQSASFALVAGEGAMDNDHFYIDGTILKSNTIFDFNLKSLYSIRVKATSSGGDFETSLRIRVVNASLILENGDCRQTFENMNFSYTSLEANAAGHLFATTSNGRILRSTDEGKTWNVVSAGNYSLSEIFFIGDTGFVQGNNVFLKSDDGGATWVHIYLPLTGEYYFNKLAAFFLTEEKGYVGTEEGEIFFTDDGGRSWETRFSGAWYEFRDLFFLSEDKGYALASYGDLYQTTDGGRSWTEVDLSALGWNPRLQDIWFTNDNDGFLIGEYTLYTTHNGGQTWVAVPEVQVSDIAKIKFDNEDAGFIIGNGVMYKTNNGGDTWSVLYPGISPGGITGVTQSSGKIYIAGKSYYYSYQSARSIAMSSDQGATWSTLNYFSDGHIYHIDFSIEKNGFITGENGLFKTEDNGFTWKQTPSDLTNVGDTHFIDKNTVILLSAGDIYKSTDGGVTTRKVLTTSKVDPYRPAGTLYGFAGNILFSVSWYAVYRSDDLGETWKLVSTDPGYYTQGMHFISPSIGYRIELFGSVEKTIDGGKTWSPVFTREPSESEAFNDIFFLNENVGYAGGEHLRKSVDGGKSWKKINWQFYDIIAIHFENEAHGYVVTRGGNVYETTDAGATWKTIFITSSNVHDVQFNNDAIYLAGENGFAARMDTTPMVPPQPGYIYGPERVCPGDAAEFYVSVKGNYSTQWSTTAGNVEDHSGYITVDFPATGEYTITARHFNACGISALRTTKVVVSGTQATPIIDGPNPATSGAQNVTYSVINGNDDAKFLWEVTGSSSISPVNKGVVVNWAEADNATTGEVKTLAIDASGCRAYGALVVQLEVPLAVETDLDNYITIYPNPSEADTKIASSYEGLVSVRIMDMIGREYTGTTLSFGEEQTLRTRQLPAGLYIVEISDGTNSITKKLIRK